MLLKRLAREMGAIPTRKAGFSTYDGSATIPVARRVFRLYALIILHPYWHGPVSAVQSWHTEYPRSLIRSFWWMA